MQQIIIEGDLARIVETNVIAEAPLADLSDHLITRLPTTFPILPRNTRWVTLDPANNRGALMVEMAPKVALLRISNYDEDEDEATTDDYRVALPYQYFVYFFRLTLRPEGALEQLVDFTIDGAYLYWSPRPVRSEQDRLWNAQIPNVDGGAHICWGSTDAETSSFSARIDDLTAQFDTTTFNSDLSLRTPYGDGALDTWALRSEGLAGSLSFADWEMFNDTTNRQWRSITVGEIAGMAGVDHTATVRDEPSFAAIPPLPTNFTVARAREYLIGLPENTRLRLLAAASLLPGAEPAAAAPRRTRATRTATA